MHLEPVNLETLGGGALEPLLTVERDDYLRAYRWNFDQSAALVNDLVSTRGLKGVALLAAGEPVGYSYFVLDNQKAIVGDAYVRAPYDTPGNERLLMAATLEAIRKLPSVRRVEAQPMMLRYPYSHPRATRHERLYLELFLPEAEWPPRYELAKGYRLDTWSWRHEAAAGRVLYDAYRGHVDAQINDHYLGQASATEYLRNLVSYPGNGKFQAEGSFMIEDLERDCVAAILCTSEIHPGTGHITQLCVDRSSRGVGLGRVLLYAALAYFTERRWRWATLSVTSANEIALEMYKRAGFAERSRLYAYVWPQWPY
jgi:ribosomal protein S18 acetylase RimI-like enzyme